MFLKTGFPDIGVKGYGTEFKGIGGRIKKTPDDFTVAEVLSEDARKTICQKGYGYPLYVMTKRNVDVLTAKSLLEGVLRTGVNLLGLKDKRAVTHQFASCRTKRASRDAWQQEGVKAIHTADTARPLTRRDLLGNAFRVKVTECEPLAESVSLLADALGQLKVPNFFGLQRFGTTKPNHIIGRHIVKREFETAALLAVGPHDDPVAALRKVPIRVRRLYISAYQSYLFNRCLSKVLEGDVSNSTNGVFLGFDRFRPHVDKEVTDHHGPTRSKGWVQMCPLPGYSFRERDSPYWNAMSAVMKDEGVSPRDFYVKEMQEVSAEGGLRAAWMIGWLRRWRVDCDVHLSFVLYKGEFATVLLRELMKNDTTIRT